MSKCHCVYEPSLGVYNGLHTESNATETRGIEMYMYVLGILGYVHTLYLYMLQAFALL